MVQHSGPPPARGRDATGGGGASHPAGLTATASGLVTSPVPPGTAPLGAPGPAQHLVSEIRHLRGQVELLSSRVADLEAAAQDTTAEVHWWRLWYRRWRNTLHYLAGRLSVCTATDPHSWQPRDPPARASSAPGA